MIEKPEHYYDTRRHQLYYQWRESEHYIHQEPIYDRTSDYIESLETQNAKLRELAADAWCYINHPTDSSWTHMRRKEARGSLSDRMRELGIEVDE